jgi:hypothetical protein
MDTALVVISLLSLGLAGALLVYAARLQRDERHRSRARVEALAAAIATPGPVIGTADRAWTSFTPAAGGEVPVFRDTCGIDDDDIDDEDNDRGTPIDQARPARESGRHVALGVAGALVLVAAALALAVPALGHRAGAAASTPAAPAWLELGGLTSTTVGDTLVVSGTVRNPGLFSRSDLQVVVFTFDAAGSVITSARAAIDARSLVPGATSTFTVRIPGAAASARYRVSFRDDDAMVPHLDRREAAPPAAPASGAAHGS